MNKTTTLMLMAAGLATMPLVAADSPAAVEGFTALAAHAAPATDMQKLVAELAPAALLPADVDLAIVLPDIQAFGEEVEEIPLGCVVLGCGKGFADSCTAAGTCQLLSYLPELVQTSASEWKETALESLGDLISQTAARFAQESADKVAGVAGKISLPPIYLIAAPKAGAEEMIKQMLDVYTSMLVASLQEQEGVETATFKDLRGIKISGSLLAESIDLDESDSANISMIKAELAKRTFYLLAGMKNGNAAVVLCENPEQIRWAETPEQSVLTGDLGKSADFGAESKPWALLSLSPQASQAIYPGELDTVSGLIKQVGDLFQSMAEKESAQAAVFHAAAAGMQTFAGEIAAVQAVPTTKPTTMTAWGTPGHVHITIKGDARGNTYKPGKLCLTDVSTAPQNVLYFESTGITSAKKTDFGKLMTAADDVIKGITATQKPEAQEEIMQAAANVLPGLKNVWQGLCTIGESFGGSTTAVVNFAETTAYPDFCLCTGLADRAKLEQGTAAVGTAIRDLLVQLGGSEDMLQQLPIETKTSGDSTVYSIAIPDMVPGLCPNVIVSSNRLALGTSTALSAQVMQSATGNTDFAGCAFSINFAGLAKVANTLVPKDDDDESEDTDVQIRDTIDTIAEFADAMKGTSTIQDGSNTIHIDVILKK